MGKKALLSALAAVGAAAALGAAVPPAVAGDNTPGRPYENKVVGFQFRPLNEWAAIPPGTDPGDPKICGFYTDAAKFDRTVAKPQVKVYAFKQAVEGTSTPAGGGLAEGDVPPDEADLRAMIEASMRFKSTRAIFDSIRQDRQTNADAALAAFEEKKRKKMLKDIDAREPVEKEVKSGDVVLTTVECEVPYALTNGRDTFIEGVRFVAGWTRNDEYEVGLLYEIPSKEWRKYGRGVYASIASLEFLPGEDVAAARKDLADALAGKSGDERWLEEIKRKVVAGWDHLQTRNYLLIFDKAVKPDRVKLIAVQIEAIRKDVYEVLFPADRPITAISVVRVCKDKEQYGQYGGPGGSAGYWNSGEQELVFYEDTGAKKDALRVLNHEAFHQYIFYSVGSISPHDWFNEGHGDYFSGFNFSGSGRFIPKPFSWRRDIIRSAMGKSHIPLREFVKYSHQQYYGPMIGQNYAQGWSLIWFLRGTRNPEWQGILGTYFNTLKSEVTRWVNDQIDERKKDGTYKEGWKPEFTPNDVEEAARTKALEAAYGGWDDRKWARFEKEWLDFKY